MMTANRITEIEITDQVYLWYWQERGGSSDARIKSTSIIYYPTPNLQVNGATPIAGVALATLDFRAPHEKGVIGLCLDVVLVDRGCQEFMPELREGSTGDDFEM